MPFLEQSPADVGPRQPGLIEPSEPVTWERGEVLDAAIRQHNPVFNAYQFISDRSGLTVDPEHNPWDVIGGTPYEAYADRFLDSTSEAETRLRMQRIEQEEDDRRLVDAAGFPGMVASVAAGLVDPTLMLPAGVIVKGARGAGAIKTAASFGAATGGQAAIAESILYGTQQTRTLEESTLNVATATILGGFLGGAAGHLASGEYAKLTDVLDEYRTNMNAEMGGQPVSEVGAAQARQPGLQLEFALGTERAGAGISPVTRLQTSEFEAAKATVRDLADAGLVYRENWQGIPTSEGGTVETRVKLWKGGLAETSEGLDDAYARYWFGKHNVTGWERQTAGIRSGWASVRGSRGNKLTAQEFRQEIGRAMSRGDQHPIPEIAEAATLYRNKVFEPLKKRAMELGLLPEEVKTVGAESYLTRVYNREKIQAQSEEFIGALTDHLKGKRKADLAAKAEVDAYVARNLAGVGEVEAKAAVKLYEQGGSPEAIAKRLEDGTLDKALAKDELREGIAKPLSIKESLAASDDTALRQLAEEVTNTILGESSFRLPGLSLVQGPRGPLKERVLRVPDEVLEPWLERDVEKVARIYTRTMAADVELTAKFGDVTMKEQLARLTDELNQKRAKATTEKQRRAINKQFDAARRDMEALRDRIRGVYAMPANPDAIGFRLAKLALNANYLARLGGVTISSIPDLGRPIMRYGLDAFRDGWGPLIKSLGNPNGAYKLSLREARLAGTAIDMIRDQRAVELADLLDDYGRHGKFEQGVQWAADRFSLINLMSPWNGFMKGMSGVITSANVLKAARAVAEGKATAKQIRNLAASGIDEQMATRIWKQAEKGGGEVDGIYLPNTEDWADLKAVTAFRAAINREAENLIVTPGVEKPLWTSGALGRVIGQFKSFSLVSTQRVLMAGLQQRDAAALAGVVHMLALGAMVGAIKAQLRGEDYTQWDAGRWAAEAFDQSGLLGVLGEANQMSKKVAGIGFGQPVGRYDSRSALGAVLGPTADAFGDFAQSAGALTAGLDSERELGRRDLHAIRKILPLQNLFYFRKLFDAAENAMGDTLGLPARSPRR